MVVDGRAGDVSLTGKEMLAEIGDFWGKDVSDGSIFPAREMTKGENNMEGEEMVQSVDNWVVS